MSIADHDSEPRTAELTDTAPAALGGFRIDDPVEHEREREAIAAALFGTAAPQLKIGRFTILQRVGQGGMGTVYAAYDEELDRKVAVKVLRRQARDTGAAQAERLRREAQAMARLSHPNTVTVHEVGEHEGGVFVAMEFVRGHSLDRWLTRDPPRPWSEVVEVFRQAGLGLAAAHEAGIVHRDFKPHNVIRGEDGVVRVLDFGLARALEPGEPRADASHPDESGGTEAASASKDPDRDTDPSSSAASSSAAASSRLTVTGTLLGTPAYMAPEQWLGRNVDARADQFGFCAALHEGLHGQLPFAGDTPAALLDAILAGRVRQPANPRVPAWINRAVLRGLATEPAERHPSMAALVELLGRDPARTRRRWIRGATLATLVAGSSVALTLTLRGPEPEPCTGFDQALAGTFDEPRMQRVEAAVLATGLGYAGDTWERIGPRLQRYADDWVAQGQAACRAHHDGRMSSTLFDRATACLARSRDSLDTLLAVFEAADAGVVEGAIDAVAKLPDLAACLDEARLAAEVPGPRDPALAAAVAAERERLARARVLHDTGRLDESLALLAAALERAEDLGEPALLAEVELARGTVAQEDWSAEEADAGLGRALALALSIGHTQVATEAAARRIHVRATMQYRFAEALVDLDYGAALLERSGDRGALAWLYYNNAGTLQDTRGADDDARRLYAQALAALDQGDRIEAVFTRSNLAQLEVEHHRFDVGIAAQREALAAAQRLYGPRHPMTATLLYILANMLSEAGAHTEARKLGEQALALEAAAHGDASSTLDPHLALLGKLDNARRRHDEAAALAERGLATETAPSFFGVRLRHVLGDARIGQGRIDEGLASHREALALAGALFADQPAQLAWSHQALARALLAAGAPAATGETGRSQLWIEAREQARRAVESREASPDSSAVELAAALLCLARVELALADQEIEATLERAASALAELPVDSPLRSELWRLRGELAEARGDWTAAASALRRAAASRDGRCDWDDPDLAAIHGALARVLAALDDDDAGPARAAREAYAALGPAYAAERRALER